jgi:hypothetical protein
VLLHRCEIAGDCDGEDGLVAFAGHTLCLLLTRDLTINKRLFTWRVVSNRR